MPSPAQFFPKISKLHSGCPPDTTALLWVPNQLLAAFIGSIAPTQCVLLFFLSNAHWLHVCGGVCSSLSCRSNWRLSAGLAQPLGFVRWGRRLPTFWGLVSSLSFLLRRWLLSRCLKSWPRRISSLHFAVWTCRSKLAPALRDRAQRSCPSSWRLSGHCEWTLEYTASCQPLGSL